MPSFKAIIQRFKSKGEKTGWTYVDIPPDVLKRLKPPSKQGFRIKGVIDDAKFERLAVYPIGDGEFIIAINGELRKKLGKKEGAMVSIKMELDVAEALQSPELIDCLNEDLIAKKHFESLGRAHRNYFHRYIYSAKGQATKAGRLVNVIDAMHRKEDFGQMVRRLKAEK